jgi:hypothetical protein
MVLKSVIAAAALCGSALLTPASAMPIDNMAHATPAQVDQVRLVCGPRGCWRTGPRIIVGPRFVGPRFYGHRAYGWRGPRYHRFRRHW